MMTRQSLREKQHDKREENSLKESLNRKKLVKKARFSRRGEGKKGKNDTKESVE